MNEHDQQRFAKMITDFVEGCQFERPFHLVVIDARGTASVHPLRSQRHRTGLRWPEEQANRLQDDLAADGGVRLEQQLRQVGEDHHRGGAGDDAVNLRQPQLTDQCSTIRRAE